MVKNLKMNQYLVNALASILNISSAFSCQKQGSVTLDSVFSSTFYISPQFLSVVNPGICLIRLPPGDHLPLGQLETTYLTHPTDLYTPRGLHGYAVLSTSYSLPSGLCLFALNPPSRSLCGKPAWVTPWIPIKTLAHKSFSLFSFSCCPPAG